MCLTAFCLALPSHILDVDFDTSDLTELNAKPDLTCLSIISLVQVCCESDKVNSKNLLIARAALTGFLNSLAKAFIWLNAFGLMVATDVVRQYSCKACDD